MGKGIDPEQVAEDLYATASDIQLEISAIERVGLTLIALAGGAISYFMRRVNLDPVATETVGLLAGTAAGFLGIRYLQDGVQYYLKHAEQQELPHSTPRRLTK